jgi:HEAT repeat protein
MRLSTEDKLAMLARVDDDPNLPDAVRNLRKALTDGNHLVVARGARIASKQGLSGLVPDLVGAFDRLLPKPHKSDPGCLAKIAIVKALDSLYYNDEDDVFPRGIRHVQMEPVYGGLADTAALLRASSASGLARTRHPDLFFLLAALLTDPETEARRAAAAILSTLVSDQSELLLRMKIMMGDRDEQVTCECLSGLMNLNPERSIDFVAGFLASDDPVIMEEAALALGESRTERAFEILCGFRDSSLGTEAKKMAILPIALTRLDRAFDYLIDIVARDNGKYAIAAIEALAIFMADGKRRERIREAVASRDEKDITEVFRQASEAAAGMPPDR